MDLKFIFNSTKCAFENGTHFVNILLILLFSFFFTFEDTLKIFIHYTFLNIYLNMYFVNRYFNLIHCRLYVYLSKYMMQKPELNCKT